MAGDLALRDLVVTRETIQLFIDFIDKTMEAPQNQSTIMWVLSNFVRSDSLGFAEVSPIFHKILPLISSNLYHEALGHACWCIKFITDRLMGDCMPYFLENNCHYIQVFVSLLCENPEILSPVVRIIGSTIGGNANLVLDFLVEKTDFLDRINEVIANCKAELILCDIYWQLSNVKAYSHIQRLLDHEGLRQKILDALKTQSFLVQKQIIWIIANMTAFLPEKERLPECTRKLMEYGFIEPLCEVCKHPDVNLAICLQALQAMLDAGEGFVDDSIIYNPVALKMADCGALDMLNKFSHLPSASAMVDAHFGEKYELFLARIRGFSKKRAY